MISLEKFKILTPLQKLPTNVGDLGKLIVAKGFEKLTKKLPNLVTLLPRYTLRVMDNFCIKRKLLQRDLGIGVPFISSSFGKKEPKVAFTPRRITRL